MVGIVIISHSKKIAEGIKDLAKEMAEEVKIEAAGGTEDGRIGTSLGKISQAIYSAFSEDGVLVLFDLGSAYMNAEMAIELLEPHMSSKIKIVDTALVEGAVVAAIKSSIGQSIEEIIVELKNMSLGKI